jgi:hypothetical protein
MTYLGLARLRRCQLRQNRRSSTIGSKGQSESAASHKHRMPYARRIRRSTQHAAPQTKLTTSATIPIMTVL